MNNSLINNENNENNTIYINVDCDNEIEKIIELNKITLMLYGVELHKIKFKNNDITDLRIENLIF